MDIFAYKVKNKADLESKPRVYFTCHPEDFTRSFDKVSEDIFKSQDCIIYYTPDMAADLTGQSEQADLERMNLFVIPVSFRLMSTPNRAMDHDLGFAREKTAHIAGARHRRTVRAAG